MDPRLRTAPLTSTLPPAPGSSFNPFDEYKLLVQDTTLLGNRRYTAGNIYLTVNSVLLGALALLVQQGQLTSFLVLGVALIVAIAGFVVAGQWRQLIRGNKRLLALRFRELRKFEESPLFPGAIKIFHKEDELYDPTGKRPRFGFSLIEEQLPRMFQILYVFSYVFSAVVLIAGTIAVRYHWLPSLLQHFGLPPS